MQRSARANDPLGLPRGRQAGISNRYAVRFFSFLAPVRPLIVVRSRDSVPIFCDAPCGLISPQKTDTASLPLTIDFSCQTGTKNSWWKDIETMSTQALHVIEAPTVTYRWNVYNAVPDMAVTPKRPGYSEREIPVHPTRIEVEVSSRGAIMVSITGQYISPEGRFSRQNTMIRYRPSETDHVHPFGALPAWALPYLHHVEHVVLA